MNPTRLFLALVVVTFSAVAQGAERAVSRAEGAVSRADGAVSRADGAVSGGAGRWGDEVLRRQFKAETDRIAARCLEGIRSLEDWEARRGEWRRQLAEMLGLWPMPERSDLKAVVTGSSSHEGFSVENVHFQSLPGFYVTANLYLPKGASGAVPTILYLSGHGPVISNGVSYGNKVAYQHHGAWFARNGYACMVLDSVQLGEIQGLHHGTHRENLWWWNSRGYTPAGAEAWNCIRALDYLATRPEVDTNRFGATGRSGGGAYSWWVAALDERIKVAAPVAGVTDLRNHVVDGTVEGHCDCMFMVNTRRWDYPQVASLVAPRPLLIVNTDADSIFPLDGVQRLHSRVRDIYRLHGAADKLGLVIAPGPHKDTQDLQVPVFRWFNKHLKGADPLIDMAAVRLCTPEQLRVFRVLPTDAINTNIHETFVPAAPTASVPSSKSTWALQRDRWLASLAEKCFAGWPEAGSVRPPALSRIWSATAGGVRVEAHEYSSEEGLPLRLYVAEGVGSRRARGLDVTVLGGAGVSSRENPGDGFSYDGWLALMSVGFGRELGAELAAVGRAIEPSRDGWEGLRRELAEGGSARVWIVPRGVGLTAWTDTAKNRVHVRRRFMLLGRTLDGMRVWDIRRAVQALRAREGWRLVPLTLRGSGAMACDAMYASLFEAGVDQLDLWRLPSSHRGGPDYLNVLQVLDVPQALAMAAERGRVTLEETGWGVAAYTREVVRTLGWSADRLRVNGPTEVQ